ncbi:MAG: type II toxin-antitoxin system VapC family toxin [Methanobrevibacter sp.]|nr:type II toxin-antitoxin system VapC family toxin [Methanobrevibacter sp.]
MKYFLDTSFILSLILDSDSNHEKAINLLNILNEDCYINNNVLNEVLTLIGRKLNVFDAKEVYFALIDSFTLLNEYNINDYNNKTFEIFEENIGENSKKTKLSFTDSSIILTMNEYDIDKLVSFDEEFKRINGITLIN